MAINPKRPIITYENVALLQSKSPAYNASSNKYNNISFLPLVDNINFSFDIQRTNVSAIGTKSFVNKSIKNAPDVKLTINTSDIFGDMFSGMFSGSGVSESIDLDKNFYALIGDQRGVDAYSSNLSEVDVVSFGNCFIESVSMNQSVNGLMTSEYSFEASNVQAQKITKSGDVFIGDCPAIDLARSQVQGLTFELPDAPDINKYYNSQNFNRIIPSYSTNVFISGNNSIGNFLIKSDSIQDFTLNLPINRKAVYGIGKKYPLTRKAMFPSEGSFNFSNKVSAFELSGFRANLKDFLNLDESYTLIISGQSYGESGFNVRINEANFKSQSLSSSTSQEMVSDLSFDFDINKFEVITTITETGYLLLQSASYLTSDHLIYNDGGYVILEEY